MERAKLSGELLVSKTPPHAGRPVQRLLSLADDADADVFGAPLAAGSEAKRTAAGRKTAFRIVAIGAVLIATVSVGELALLQPVGGKDPVAKAAPPVPLPMAAAKLARTAVEPALRPPALQPLAIASPSEPVRSPIPARPAAPATVPSPATAAARISPTTPAAAAPATIAAREPAKPPAAAVAAIQPAKTAAPPPASRPPVASPLRAQGDALFAAGRFAPARLFYQRAAEAGDARAALQLGETYDPAFLAQAGIVGERGNPAAAAYWYQRASKLGAADAELLLKAVMAEPGRIAPH